MAANGNGVETHWGFGIPSFVPPASNVTALAAGPVSILALHADGSVTASSGTTLPPGLTNILAISAGPGSSLALRGDGSILAWGSSFYGETNIPPGLLNVAAIACGSGHDIALKSDGTVAAWGDNSYGQTNVPVGLSNVIAVAAGWYHNLVLKSDGTVISWGDNTSGQTNVPPGLTNVVSVAAGNGHSLALRSDGTVIAWGQSFFGQTNIPAKATNVIAISSGDSHCLALISNGAPYAIRFPSIQTSTIGGTVTLNAGVVGAQPLSYQWQFNGTNISGATFAIFSISNLTVTSAGTYRCIATNAIGSIVTPGATLAVVWPPLRFDASPGVLQMTASGLRLRLLNLTGAGTVVIEASSDLTSWQPILINPPVTGTLDFTDSTGTKYTRRFYRAYEGGTLALGPLLLDQPTITNGARALNVRGLTGHGSVILYASTNLSRWDPILTNPPTVGSTLFLDPATNHARRFYRALQQ
jgi:hypothetical protein